ncbi:uncharacterized protein LOC114727537 [Neltuma alba]|uniref:uncharacterized protein LOC114727537 n=1 Tax=Neltuma alba TaxID=207710 RepID=UPI0010A52F49|nr:uncharacterized protein LOC114727537 [Prosopis alba]
MREELVKCESELENKKQQAIATLLSRKNAKLAYKRAHYHSLIRGLFEAILAWDFLYSTYNAPPSPSPPPDAEELEMGNLYRAISENNWSAAKASIARLPKILDVDFAASTGETPLHGAVKFGHVDIVEELVRLVSAEYLEIYDAYGCTPLVIAASHNGVIPIASCLVNKNRNALVIPMRGTACIPAIIAFRTGLKEVGRYLYDVTPLEVFKPENGIVGSLFLQSCLGRGDLDVALHLLRRCTKLLFAADDTGYSVLQYIAGYLSSSLNKIQLPFWKRWVYQHYIKIPSTTATGHLCEAIQQEGKNNKPRQGIGGLLHRLISRICDFSGMKEIRKMKLQQAQAAEILNLVCQNAIVSNEKKNIMAGALKTAATEGNVEFLLQVVKANPQLISLFTFICPPYWPVFCYAVASRKAEIFNLLRCFRFNNVVAATIDQYNNSLLHVAASLAPASYLNGISGAALQMQRELQWFKAVEKMVDPGYRYFVNKESLNPFDFFKKNHNDLRDKGEKWMKDTASSCSVVGALIVTIMFAAALTVPGGNNQNSGYPMFIEKRLFKVFLISDALSLFSSTTSVLTFLGILTSRYSEDDFLYSLPRKLIIGLSTLFLSIATMMIAFSATVMIMLQSKQSRSWALLPVAMLAGVPITLFVLLQFPLLVEVISSTYGRGIFKKVKKWP